MKYLVLFLISILNVSCNRNVKEKAFNGNSIAQEVKAYKYGAGDIVSKGYLDSKGNLWFTTSNEGVYKYNGKEFLNIRKDDGLCSDDVSSVIEDKNGKMWFATAKGLCKYDGSSFFNIPLPKNDSLLVSPKTGFPSRTTENVMNLIIDKKANFWLGTDASGAYKYDGTDFTPFLRFEGKLQPDSVYNNCITSILEDESGNIWFTSMTHGAITRFDGQTLTNFNVKDGLLGDMITSSFQDSNGDIWFGSIQNLDGGISRWNGNNFTNFTVKDGLCDSNVTCFYQDESGKIWIGTGNGVCYYDGEKFTNFNNNGKSLGDIRFITKDREGNLWFGGRYGVLWQYDGKNISDFTYEKRRK